MIFILLCFEHFFWFNFLKINNRGKINQMEKCFFSKHASILWNIERQFDIIYIQVVSNNFPLEIAFRLVLS